MFKKAIHDDLSIADCAAIQAIRSKRGSFGSRSNLRMEQGGPAGGCEEFIVEG